MGTTVLYLIVMLTPFNIRKVNIKLVSAY